MDIDSAIKAYNLLNEENKCSKNINTIKNLQSSKQRIIIKINTGYEHDVILDNMYELEYLLLDSIMKVYQDRRNSILEKIERL